MFYKDSLFQRKQKGHITQRPTYLIFCEGETEKYYFEDLKKEFSPTITIECQKLQYKNFTGMSNEIIKYKNKMTKTGRSYDRIFCVCDNNNISYSDFCNGSKKMKNSKIELIYSNKSFEVWILMHFEEFNRKAVSQNEYQKHINQYLQGISKPYIGLYNTIKDKLENAVTNSKRVNLLQLSNNNNEKFYCEPYTDNYIIIEGIIKDFK